MTSDEIHKTVLSICDSRSILTHSERQALYPLWEIAYQLAVLNERNAKNDEPGRAEAIQERDAHKANARWWSEQAKQLRAELEARDSKPSPEPI